MTWYAWIDIGKTCHTCDKYRAKHKNDHSKQHEIAEERIVVHGTRGSADEWPQAADVGVTIRVFQSGINLALFFYTVCDRDVDKSIATPLRTGRRAIASRRQRRPRANCISPSQSEKSFRKLSPIIAVPRN